MTPLEVAWSRLAKRIALLPSLLACLILSTPAVLGVFSARGGLGHMFLWLTVTTWGVWVVAMHSLAVQVAPSTMRRFDRLITATGAVAVSASCVGFAGIETGGQDGLSFILTAFGILGWIVAAIAWTAIHIRTAYVFEKANAKLVARPPTYHPWILDQIWPPPLAVLLSKREVRRLADSA